MHRQSGKPVLDFKAVSARAASMAGSIVPVLLPGGKRVGVEYVVRSPLRDDKHAGSFGVNLATGQWHDFATGEGGDLIRLYAAISNLTDFEACQRLGQALGL